MLSGFLVRSVRYQERRRSSPSRVATKLVTAAEFELEFRGPVSDAQPLKEFLEPQLRDAASKNLEAGFELAFAEGLPMQGDAPEKLTERLARFASGAAYVSATAEVKA